MPFVPEYLNLAAYILIAFSVVSLVLSLYMVVQTEIETRRFHRERLEYQHGASEHWPDDRNTGLSNSLRKRSLTVSGRYSLPVIWLNKLILQSGVNCGIAGILTLMFGIGLAFLFTLIVLGFHPVFGFAVAVVLSAACLLWGLIGLRKRRQAVFERQFSDAVDIVARSLRAGHPMQAAMAMVAKEMPDPISTEFSIVGEELMFGLDLHTALSNLRVRVGQADISLFVMATSIHNSTGGNLSEVLKKLSTVVRNRFRMRRKAQALASEGRWSTYLLTVIPFIVFAMIWIISPDYYGSVWGYPWIRIVLFLSVVWLITGNFIMRRMSDLDI